MDASISGVQLLLQEKFKVGEWLEVEMLTPQGVPAFNREVLVRWSAAAAGSLGAASAEAGNNRSHMSSCSHLREDAPCVRQQPFRDRYLTAILARAILPIAILLSGLSRMSSQPPQGRFASYA